ncbi:methionyl-tRNA formyltransferase [Kordiimonas sp.]|uniref:methionyl-tRNA formyltransferase n=1 Tax=Kordiimonas sp. TaxID=1970157 RepID=UPI003B527ECC
MIKPKVSVLISKVFGLSCLEVLSQAGINIRYVVTIDDRLDTRSAYNEIQAHCRRQSLNLKVSGSPSDTEGYFNEDPCDIVFVFCWYQIIKSSIIAGAQGGVFGIHHSLLPSYRGQAPLIWSLLAGDKVIGSTLFRIDGGIDTGPIAHQWSLEVNQKWYLRDIIAALEGQILLDLGKCAVELIEGRKSLKPQPTDQASYSSTRIPEDSRISWQDPAHQVLRHIRTLNSPYPESFTFFGEDRLSVGRAEAFPYRVHGVPGSIFKVDGRSVVCCGDGYGVVISEVKNTKGDHVKSFPIGTRFK